MSDKYVEKTFLYLVSLSVLLHLAIFGLVTLLPAEKTKNLQEPTMVDITDLPDLPPPLTKPETKRVAEKPRRVTGETAPKGSRETERLRQQPNPARPSRAEASSVPLASPIRKEQPGRIPQASAEPIRRGEGLFKQKSGEVQDSAMLLPSAGKMARLEESYRKKYGPEVEDGETKFLNTTDIRFGSFLRHFETAVYGVWHYPQAAAQRGIEGVTTVKITFNRGGEIVHVELLDGSGSGILDDEVMRSLKQIGPIGSFPKGYPGETFTLIAFFQYGGGARRLS